MTRALLFTCILSGCGLVAAGYFGRGFVLVGGILLATGLAWVLGVLRGLNWVSAPGLFVVYGFAAAGFFLDPGAALPSRTLWAGSVGLDKAFLLLGGLSGLMAWDLSDFSARLRLASPEDDIPGLERRHFLRLALVSILGLGLSLVALTVRIKFSFEWSVGLIILGIWGIGRMISWLMQSRA